MRGDVACLHTSSGQVGITILHLRGFANILIRSSCFKHVPSERLANNRFTTGQVNRIVEKNDGSLTLVEFHKGF